MVDAGDAGQEHYGMDRVSFHIGLEFWSDGRRYRCTDVGSRVVVAIRVDSAEIATSDGVTLTTRKMSGEQADAEGWFSGPPYGVLEQVFDEDDLEGCSLKQTSDEALAEDIRPIRTDEDHLAAMREIEALWGAEPGTPEGDKLDVLATLVDAYEREHFPVDPLEPVETIKARNDNA